MIRNAMIASALALAAATPLTAQMTAAEVGVSPMSGTSATDYVKLAADSDLYEIQSSRLALTRSKRADVKDFANQMIADHTQTSKSLKAALSNGDRKIASPSTQLSDANKAKITLLKKAPAASFDNLYLTQQADAHKMAWSLHKGYADTGTDATLKQVALTAVPVIERHLGHVKGLTPASLAR